MSDIVGGRVTGSDAEGPVTMPEGTGVGVAHDGSVPKIPVYGRSGYRRSGRGISEGGAGRVVGSAIGTSAVREARSVGAAARAEAATAG